MTRAALWIGRIETDLLQPDEQIIGVQRRELADAPHALAAEQPHVHVGAQQHTDVTAEAGEPPDRLR